MDPQTPNFNETVPTPPSPVPESPKKDPHGITIAAMAAFVLLSLGAIVFLYNQNQTLKSMLAGFQAPSPTPTSATTPDPTANWNTYVNPVEKFSFKYPSTWTLDTQNEMGEEEYNNINIGLKLTKGSSVINIMANMDGVGGALRNVPFEEISLWGKTYYKQYGDMDYSTNTKTIHITSDPHEIGVFEIGNKIYQISLTYKAEKEGNLPDKELSGEFDGILSTFKFLEASPSPEAKACTLEAKICPDGSSVGRTGPNCEFAPCP